MSKTSKSEITLNLAVVSSMAGGTALFFSICFMIFALLRNTFSIDSRLVEGITTLITYPLILGLYLSFPLAILAIPVGSICLIRNRRIAPEVDITSHSKTFKHSAFGIVAGFLYFLIMAALLCLPQNSMNF